MHRTPSTGSVAEKPAADPMPADIVGTDELSQDMASFFDVSLDMLCIRDLSGRFVRLNRAWETVLGYPLGELEGRPLLPLIHPGDVEATVAHMDRLDRQEEQGERCECDLRHVVSFPVVWAVQHRC